MRDHFNGLTPKQAELLTLLSEECAETIQAISKIQRHGLNSTYDSGETNIAALQRELGDVLVAVALLRDAKVIHEDTVRSFALEKVKRARTFLHHIGDVDA